MGDFWKREEREADDIEDANAHRARFFAALANYYRTVPGRAGVIGLLGLTINYASGDPYKVVENYGYVIGTSMVLMFVCAALALHFDHFKTKAGNLKDKLRSRKQKHKTRRK